MKTRQEGLGFTLDALAQKDQLVIHKKLYGLACMLGIAATRLILFTARATACFIVHDTKACLCVLREIDRRG